MQSIFSPQVGFKHHKDYVGYTWAKQEESDYLRQEHHVRHETLNTCRCEVELRFSEEGRQRYLYSRVLNSRLCSVSRLPSQRRSYQRSLVTTFWVTIATM